MKLSYIVTNLKYENVKQVLKEEFGISDRLLLKLKANQKIYRNSQVVCVNENPQPPEPGTNFFIK